VLSTFFKLFLFEQYAGLLMRLISLETIGKTKNQNVGTK